MRFWAHEVAEMTGGRLHGPDLAIDGTDFDSRSIGPGQLFVPLVAERDGHDFVGAALERGAAAYLTSRAPMGGTAIEVDDTLRALMRLAQGMRGRFDGPVVGVTGSVGKTSTKDLARAALAAGRRTWANEKSFNNEQGLPTTVLNAPADSEVMVLEMGMRGFGEIAALCDIARPTIGVVTRVAEAHSDRVGGIEGVARAKAELVRALPGNGIAVLNADDERVRSMETFAPCTVLTFGESADADVCLERVELDASARPAFTVRTPWGAVEARLAMSGRHMALNAAAALAVAGASGVDLHAAAAALGGVGTASMRMHIERSTSGAIVVDDTYNANPTSMRAALDALVDLPARRRLAVLGLMAEISDAPVEHQSIAQYASARGVDVIAVGTDLYGVPSVDTPGAALDAIAARYGDLGDGDAVLVKGSRVAGLERAAAALRG
ncbi:MAG: UDP-N-acetylmuramoyl-tripeptide--D-alanyl-D-alanine ligase [Ilumatobacteraceae bacterium]